MAQTAHTDHDHGLWTHDHMFLGHGHARAERRATLATALTAIFMVVEVVAGLAFGSMALLADGIHMATHVGALGLAAGAYWLARRHAGDQRFTFGSGKFGDLAAFASAIALGIAGLGVAVESIGRLVSPVSVQFGDAFLIAVVGLVVNLICALILRDPHDHAHGHDHGHARDHAHTGDDHNLRAAYVHVLADAATSVLALAALGSGYLWGIAWLDPVVGLIGALVIGSWAYGLVRDAGMVLLDAEDDPKLAAAIRSMIEDEMGARIADLHLWRLGPGHRGLIVSLVTPNATTAEEVKAGLRERRLRRMSGGATIIRDLNASPFRVRPGIATHSCDCAQNL
jgi:cation diffusion facilitator family transporter